MSAGELEDFARRELAGVFRRREEGGRFYCAPCLAEQLRQRAAKWIFPATWKTAIEETFERMWSV